MSCLAPSSYAGWEKARYTDISSNVHHVNATGTAEGWLDTYGHPKLRLSCETTINGGELYLGFHFPAAHSFLGQHSRNEPVRFRVSGAPQSGNVQETIEYLSMPASEQSVFYTLLASDGIASTTQSAKLLLDMQYGDHLDVMFVQSPQTYKVQYSLSGFSDVLDELLASCQLSGLSYANLGKTWADYIAIVEVAGLLVVDAPTMGASKPTR